MNAVPADILYDRACAPSVLLFGDDSGRRGRLADRILLSGGRVMASEPVGVGRIGWTGRPQRPSSSIGGRMGVLRSMACCCG